MNDRITRNMHKRKVIKSGNKSSSNSNNEGNPRDLGAPPARNTMPSSVRNEVGDDFSDEGNADDGDIEIASLLTPVNSNNHLGGDAKGNAAAKPKSKQWTPSWKIAGVAAVILFVVALATTSVSRSSVDLKMSQSQSSIFQTSEGISTSNSDANIIDGKNNDGNIKNTDGKNNDGNSKSIDGKNNDGNSESMDGKNNYGDSKNTDGKNNDGNSKSTDGKNNDGNSKSMDGKNNYGDSKSTDGKNNGGNSKIIDGKNNDRDGKNTDGKNNDGNSKSIDRKGNDGNSKSIDRKGNDGNSKSMDGKNNDGNSIHKAANNNADNSDNMEAENKDAKKEGPATPSQPPTLKTPKPTSESGRNDDGMSWFELHTGNERIDRAYRLAMDELENNIAYSDSDGNATSPFFIAGAGWDQLWTRDTAYAVELAGGLVRPDVSRQSLGTCTEDVELQKTHGNSSFHATVWYQDKCGHFGGWPNLSDAIVGARGAWHLYLYTGNTTFLEWAYETTISSLLRAEQQVLIEGKDPARSFENALFGGCSSFMESNSGYPKKYRMNGTLVGKTKALSTNILYYNGYYYAYKMGKLLMENSETVDALKQRFKALKRSIRDRLWMEGKGLYAYFEDEDGRLVEQTEGLGIALALLSEEFESEHRVKMILERTYRTGVGVPSLWPRFDLGDWPNDDDHHISQRYHNGRIWPFVSGYFALAAARHGRLDIFAQEMASLVDLSEQQDTFAEFYELDKSFPPKRRRQLWSDTGYLGMVYKGVFGMNFQPDGIEFSPSKDDGKSTGLAMDDTISLLNVKYRGCILDIHVTGVGNNVMSFKVNGKVSESPKIDSNSTGRYLIEIEVAPS